VKLSGDLLTAEALLLTVVALLHTLWYQEISASLAKLATLPQYKGDALDKWKPERSRFWGRAIPLLIATAGSLLVFSPVIIDVLYHAWDAVVRLGGGALQYYDPIAAAFVLVGVLTGYVCLLLIQQNRRFLVIRWTIHLKKEA
jgi:hypothetical protein